MNGAHGEGSCQYRAFISFASKDKAVVRRLATALSREFPIWYYEDELLPGDPILAKVDEAMVSSRFAVVVLSDGYFASSWCKRELDTFLTRELAEGQEVIVPVWHGVDAVAVGRYMPALANRVAVSTADGPPRWVAEQVARALRRSGPAVLPPQPPPPTPPRWALAALAVAIAGLLAVAGTVALAGPAYFVGLDGDVVAVYRRDGLLFREETLLERKSLTVCDLSAADAAEVRAKERQPSRAAADSYVNELRKKTPPRPSACSGRGP